MGQSFESIRSHNDPPMLASMLTRPEEILRTDVHETDNEYSATWRSFNVEAPTARFVKINAATMIWLAPALEDRGCLQFRARPYEEFPRGLATTARNSFCSQLLQCLVRDPGGEAPQTTDLRHASLGTRDERCNFQIAQPIQVTQTAQAAHGAHIAQPVQVAYTPIRRSRRPNRRARPDRPGNPGRPDRPPGRPRRPGPPMLFRFLAPFPWRAFKTILPCFSQRPCAITHRCGLSPLKFRRPLT